MHTPAFMEGLQLTKWSFSYVLFISTFDVNGRRQEEDTMERNWALDSLWVTESAAIAAAKWRGRGDKNAADGAATAAMRVALDLLKMRGTVRIGEGEMDEAPMLFIGERLGTWQDADPAFDIAVDPIDGTRLCADNGPGSVTVIAFAGDGCFLNAPDIYMRKIAVGPVAKGAIDITKSVAWNLAAVAEAKRARVADLTAILLDRERHAPLIAEIRKAGASVKRISDGDVMGAIETADTDTAVDILFGSGGGPEGVLAAAALRCMGGDFQGVLLPENAEQAKRAAEMTKSPPDRVYKIDDLASGNVMFAATGVTDSLMLKGVRFHDDGKVETHSIVTRSSTRSFRWIRTIRPSTD